MPSRGDLAPIPEYDDVPLWPHNRDSVAVRMVNSAWDALFRRDLIDLSFKQLAKEIGVTSAALYHHFPNFNALGAELSVRACATLTDALTVEEGFFKDRHAKPLKAFVETWIAFAAKRPRHYDLIFSAQFRDADRYPAVAEHQMQLFLTVRNLLDAEVGRSRVEAPDIHLFIALLHGPASLVAGASHAPQPERVVTACRLFLADLRPG